MNTWKRSFVMLTVLAVLFSVNPSLLNVTAAYAENAVSTISFEEKTPPEYTMEEYEALTPQQQDEFFLWFQSIEAFEEWMEKAAPPMPWEAANKNPAEYTWDEYNELTYQQQDAFIDSFPSVDAFERWMQSAQPAQETTMPWDKDGRMPYEYTWEDYHQLTLKQQNAFIEWFDDETDFEAWMQQAQAENLAAAAMPWEKGAKKPDSYTWAEYEALTVAQKNAFSEWFQDAFLFEAWMENAQREAEEEVDKPWETGGKAPDAYTWTEFEALTFAQQDAFVEWFGAPEAFEAWMESVHPSTRTQLVIPWANDKKQPDAYTADEFEALTPYQQSQFFLWFETDEAFKQWLNTVPLAKGNVPMPWNETEKTNASGNVTSAEKKAVDKLRTYPWSAYEQLTAEQRILFFQSFSSLFSRWVKAAKPDDISDALMPWTNTKKQPSAYTWEEYTVLPVELQDAFFAWFESPDLFEEWMKTVADLNVLAAFGVINPNAPSIKVSEPVSAEAQETIPEAVEQADAAQEKEDLFPCTGRTVKNKVNIRKKAGSNSPVEGKIKKKGTEVTVLEMTTNGDDIWYLVKSGKDEGYIRGDLLELVSAEEE